MPISTCEETNYDMPHVTHKVKNRGIKEINQKRREGNKVQYQQPFPDILLI